MPIYKDLILMKMFFFELQETFLKVQLAAVLKV